MMTSIVYDVEYYAVVLQELYIFFTEQYYIVFERGKEVLYSGNIPHTGY